MEKETCDLLIGPKQHLHPWLRRAQARKLGASSRGRNKTRGARAKALADCSQPSTVLAGKTLGDVQPRALLEGELPFGGWEGHAMKAQFCLQWKLG